MTKSVHAQAPVLLKISVTTEKELPEDAELFIRGDHIFLGNWQYGQVRLKRRNPSTWGGIFILEPGETIQFLVDQGNANTIFTDTIKLTAKEAESINVTYHNGTQEYKIQPQGTLHQLPGTVQGRLQSRNVVVRTPLTYEQDTSLDYDVVYFQDGQYASGRDINDPKHWRMLSLIDSLEYQGIIKPIIAVFIDHVFSNRSMEYSDTDLGKRYQEYLCSELVPRVDALFRTKDNPENRYLTGAVAGGFISSYTALSCPDVFQNVIALSPAFLIHENDFTQSFDSLYSEQVKVYMNVGEFGMDEELKIGCDSASVIFTDNGMAVQYDFMPNTIPDGENFHNRMLPALLYFFEKKEQ